MNVKSYFFSLLALALWVTPPALAQLIVEPDGPRLQEAAGDQTLIGALIGPGNYLPVNSSETFKQKHRIAFERDFGAGTPLCFPQGTWLGPYQYDFADFNASVNYLEDQGKVSIAHLLAGGNNYHPNWLLEGNFSEEELRDMLEQFIKTAIQSNGNADKVDVWNVVNEVFFVNPNNPNNGVRASKFLALGFEPDESGFTGEDRVVDQQPVYVRLAFEYARKYTNATLELRENNCEFPGMSHDRLLYQLAAHLKNKEVPVDAIGFQTHLNVSSNYDWEGFKQNVTKYRDLGYEVYVTELDGTNDGTAEGRQQQRDLLYNAVRAAREAGVSLINFWGKHDDELGERREDDHPLLLEGVDFTPKPSYYAVQQALIETQDVSPEEPEPDTTQTSILRLTPVADAFVNSTAPTTTYPGIAVQQSEERTLSAYLRFDLTALQGRTVTAAELVLQESPTASAASNNSAISVRNTTSEWDETILTWNNQPAYQEASLGEVAANSVGEEATVSVSLDPAAFQRDGSVNLALVGTTAGNDLGFSSREDTAPPQLVLTLANDAVEPTVERTETQWSADSEGIYPNPVVDGHVSIRLPIASQDTLELQLVDLTGKVIRRQQLKGHSEVSFSVEGVLSGTYLLTVTTPQQRWTRRLIIR